MEVGWRVKFKEDSGWMPAFKGGEIKELLTRGNGQYHAISVPYRANFCYEKPELLECDHQWMPRENCFSRYCTQCGTEQIGGVTYVQYNKEKPLKVVGLNHLIEKGKKMEKPKTKLEKRACEEAKEEAVKIAVDKKRVEYVKAIERFMVEEKNARDFREQADKLKDLLGLTKEQIEQML